MCFMWTVISSWVEYYEQISDIEKIREKKENKEIYTKKRDELVNVFKQHLAEQYPDYEKDIFSKLIPENVTAVATLFPNIRASETITNYCSEVNRLTSEIYRQDTDITYRERRIRTRSRDVTGLWFLMPTK